MRHILLFLSLFLGICIGASCSDTDQTGPNAAGSSVVLPVMVTHNVSMLISDSGVIRYRAITPTWVRYGDDAPEPYQYFPDGIQFEQIDTLFDATETIWADTAYNWEDKQLWHLINNVRVISVKGEKFFTNDLYWDMKAHTVYSDSFIHIERAENIIEGYGFTSTDDFSKYEIRKTSGIFPVKEEPASEPNPEPASEPAEQPQP